jgi:hypothetical protein
MAKAMMMTLKPIDDSLYCITMIDFDTPTYRPQIESIVCGKVNKQSLISAVGDVSSFRGESIRCSPKIF